MLFKLFLLFTLVPIVELALLIELGSHIGSLRRCARCNDWSCRCRPGTQSGLLVFQRLHQQHRTRPIAGDALIDGVSYWQGTSPTRQAF